MSKEVRYFTAKWCKPCQAIKPVFAQLAKENPDITFTMVDVDDEQDYAFSLGIKGVPTFMFWLDGNQCLPRITGAKEPEIRAAVEKLKDM